MTTPYGENIFSTFEKSIAFESDGRLLVAFVEVQPVPGYGFVVNHGPVDGCPAVDGIEFLTLVGSHVLEERLRIIDVV